MFDTVAELESGRAKLGTYRYGLQGTATQWALAEALTELEPGAAGTALYSSGLAAVTAPLLTLLSAGDELLAPDNVYGPTRRFCDTFLKRYGIATRYYDPLVGSAISELIGENTRAIFLESPGSLTFEVQDVPGICTMAHDRGLTTLLDNTWATPLFFPAVQHGIDLTILAGTKYISGHSDVMLGSVTAVQSQWARLQRTAALYGQYLSPDDAFLAARGLRTLSVRLRQHEASALKIARWLDEQPQVARLLHPAFESCPGHEFWKRDFNGSTGLFAFVLKGGDEAARDALIDSLEQFGIGYSWGGFESLAVPADATRTANEPEYEGPLVRLHIGLENPDDLIADLEQALKNYRA